MEDKKHQAAKSKAAERKFTVEKLRETCFETLGVAFSTFDGAFAGRSGSYTIEEARRIIQEWENKKFTAEVE